MRKVLFLILILVQFTAFTHGGHMATFGLSFDSTHINLEFKIDVNTLSHYSFDDKCENYEQFKVLCISNYILNNSSLKIEGIKTNFEFIESNQDEHFMVLKFTTKRIINKKVKVKFSTSCFYEFDSLFENRIIVKNKNGSVTSYRTNTKTREISFRII